MAEFMVELYVPKRDAEGIEAASERARLAAEEVTQEGTPVRYLRSIFVPEDETCFYLYEAASADVVHEAASRAGLSIDRVAEAVSSSRGERA